MKNRFVIANISFLTGIIYIIVKYLFIYNKSYTLNVYLSLFIEASLVCLFQVIANVFIYKISSSYLCSNLLIYIIYPLFIAIIVWTGVLFL